MISKWYNEGIYIPSPEFLTCRIYLCYLIGRIGIPGAGKYRSQLFFISFWISVAAWLLLAASVCSMSKHSSIIKILPFFDGTLSITNDDDNSLSKMKYFAGLNIIAFDDCKTGTSSVSCPSDQLNWNDNQCDLYFKNCDNCEDTSLHSTITILIALITQFFQLIVNLTRSHHKGDYPLMKLFGIVISTAGTLAAMETLSSYGKDCFRDLEPAGDNMSMSRDFGIGVICLMAATALKAYDVIIHIFIPTPLFEEYKEETTTTIAAATTAVVENSRELEEGGSTDSDIEETKTHDYRPVVVYERKCLGTTEWKQCSVVVRDELEDDIPLSLLSNQNTAVASPTSTVGTPPSSTVVGPPTSTVGEPPSSTVGAPATSTGDAPLSDASSVHSEITTGTSNANV